MQRIWCLPSPSIRAFLAWYSAFPKSGHAANAVCVVHEQHEFVMSKRFLRQGKLMRLEMIQTKKRTNYCLRWPIEHNCKVNHV